MTTVDGFSKRDVVCWWCFVM